MLRGWNSGIRPLSQTSHAVPESAASNDAGGAPASPPTAFRWLLARRPGPPLQLEGTLARGGVEHRMGFGEGSEHLGNILGPSGKGEIEIL